MSIFLLILNIGTLFLIYYMNKETCHSVKYLENRMREIELAQFKHEKNIREMDDLKSSKNFPS